MLEASLAESLRALVGGRRCTACIEDHWVTGQALDVVTSRPSGIFARKKWRNHQIALAIHTSSTLEMFPPVMTHFSEEVTLLIPSVEEERQHIVVWTRSPLTTTPLSGSSHPECWLRDVHRAALADATTGGRVAFTTTRAAPVGERAGVVTIHLFQALPPRAVRIDDYDLRTGRRVQMLVSEQELNDALSGRTFYSTVAGEVAVAGPPDANGAMCAAVTAELAIAPSRRLAAREFARAHQGSSSSGR